MQKSKLFKTVVTLAVCASMAVPNSVMANSGRTVDGIYVNSEVKNLLLAADNSIAGVIVDKNGSPVQGAPVVLGQRGEVLAAVQTDADGRYVITSVKPGDYQLVSFAGLQTYRVHANEAPADAVRGIVQVIDQEGIERGQCQSGQCSACCECGDPSCKGKCKKGPFSNLTGCLTNPLVWGIIIAAAIAIPLALDDDDAS